MPPVAKGLTKCIILNRYRALADGWSPHEQGSRTQENRFLPLPEGHVIAPDDEDSREVRA